MYVCMYICTYVCTHVCKYVCMYASVDVKTRLSSPFLPKKTKLPVEDGTEIRTTVKNTTYPQVDGILLYDLSRRAALNPHELEWLDY